MSGAAFSAQNLEQSSWQDYVSAIVGAGKDFWSALILTAGSEGQAAAYRTEIESRLSESKLPRSTAYIVVADPKSGRLGSGGATLHALAEFARRRPETRDEAWWNSNRVLLIHSGGESRRLPSYSQSGKIFSHLPMHTPWGENATLFDHLLAMSCSWLEVMNPGLVVSSGDVILRLDPASLRWRHPGVCGIAVLEDEMTGTQHGVYVLDEHDQVYAVLQKRSLDELRAAGAVRNGRVPVDSGLLYLDGGVVRDMTGLALDAGAIPFVDLYQQLSMTLGTAAEAPDGEPALPSRLRAVLRGRGFRCALAQGDFIHIGSTSSHRSLLSQYVDAGRVRQVRTRLGGEHPASQGGGTVVDSLLAPGSSLEEGSLVVESALDHPVWLGQGGILHGLTGISSRLEVPENLVLHQLPVVLAGGRRCDVIRVYGASDDPKHVPPTWMNRPMSESLERLGLAADDVWPGIAPGSRTLWNARLFPAGTVEEAVRAARWLMGYDSGGREAWLAAARLSLGESAEAADHRLLLERRNQRRQANWVEAALELARSGGDPRPLLWYAPSLAVLHRTGERLAHAAEEAQAPHPTAAASLNYQAFLFLRQAGLEAASEQAREQAFHCVQLAVGRGLQSSSFLANATWANRAATVTAPARVDLGGGWSDTPPFCLDFGGAVLNLALRLDGAAPVQVAAERTQEPRICFADESSGESAAFTTMDALHQAAALEGPFALPQAVLQVSGLFPPEGSLEQILQRLGGGIRLRTRVNLPVGSGLGTSSILAAAMCRAVSELAGAPVSPSGILDWVMAVEQQMTTGGGWQDQAGALFPNAKLLVSMAGPEQKIRVEPVAWSAERQREFTSRFLVYYTGVRRLAKGLLSQIVGKYLARDTRTIEILHSIKTLAVEMTHAMRAGEWDYLGELLNRHWRLNQELDPNTTNARISALLDAVAPHTAGAKLAGAGGGGFILLLAKDPGSADAIRRTLPEGGAGGARFYSYEICNQGIDATIEA
ncbi:MAG: hypothetical protein IT161_16200 [Bryobacterales bacterium]|nr:hypothetical protein [Bryobacterales bacterium]